MISVIGPRLYQPIADLVGRLVSRPLLKADRVSANYFESGYTAAGIILLSAALESLVQRDRYFFLKLNHGKKASEKVGDYLQNTLRYRRHSQIRELFEVRNSAAHNHIWEIEFTNPPQGGRRHKKSNVVPGTHRLSTSPSTRARIHRTKLVRLNLVPTRLDRTDLRKALSVGIHLLDFMSKKGSNPVNLTSHQIGLNGRRIRFSELPNHM